MEMRRASLLSRPRVGEVIALQMSRTRVRVLLILLTLILLVASLIFGLLTYWLDVEERAPSAFNLRSTGRFASARLADKELSRRILEMGRAG